MQIKMLPTGNTMTLGDLLLETTASVACFGSQKKRRRLVDKAENIPSSTSYSSLVKSTSRLDLDDIVSPIDYVVSASSLPVNKSTESNLFQHRPSDDDIAAYSLEIVIVLRARNLDKLKEFHANGRSLSCCNRFGESLLHMACRRGYTEIVRFMVEEAGVSLWVHDDFGRTPLHYSCWTSEPNLELLDFLMGKAPQMLLMSDVRGHMPMNYVRKEHWKQWVHTAHSFFDRGWEASINNHAVYW